MRVKIIEGELTDRIRRACYAYLVEKYRREKLKDGGDLLSGIDRRILPTGIQHTGPDPRVPEEGGDDDAIEYIDEGVSGEFLDRPGLTRLREDVRKGLITKVVCLDPDRLSRKLMNQLIVTEEFDRHGVELVFVNGEYARTPEGQLFYS